MDSAKYDTQKRSRAGKAAVLRAVVAGYIAYLGWKIATATDTTMDRTLAYILGGLFMLAAGAIVFYIVKRYRADLEEAKISGDNAETEDEQ